MERNMGTEKELLPFVVKPGRYTNGELGSIKKEGSGKIRVVLLYPDLYEFAISSFEHRQVYSILNEPFSVAVERAYLPAPDAQKVMQEKNIPLFSVESGTTVRDFDLILFQTERKRDHFFFPRLVQLAGLPPEREQRKEGPVIVTFGKGSLWPDGLGRFFDAAVQLEGFEAAASLSKNLMELGGKFDRQRFLERLEGATVFSNGQERKGHPLVSSMEYSDYFPELLISSLDAESSFLNIKLDGLSGDFDVARVGERLQKAVAASGYNEVRFDFSGGEPPLDCARGFQPVSLEALLTPTCDYLKTVFGKVDFSNLKPELFTAGLLSILNKVNVLGIGFFLGAGVPRYRKLLGVEASEEMVIEKLREVLTLSPKQFRVYLYFGFPEETDEDIVNTARFLNDLAFAARKNSSRTYLRGYVGTFYGVAHQGLWKSPLISPKEVLRRQEILKKNLSARNLQLRYEPPEQIYLNGLWERAGEKIGDVIEGYSARLRPEEIPDDGADYQRLSYVIQEAGIDAARLLGQELAEVEDWAYRTVIVKKFPLTTSVSVSAPVAAATAAGEVQYGRSKRKIRFQPETLQVPNAVIRFRWEKGEAARYTSHLDVIKVFERALRRAGLPMAYSQGIHPHPKIAFGPPLPLGHLSTTEYLDVRFDKPYNLEFFHRLGEALPPGFRLLEARSILAKTESLSSTINVALYEVGLPAAIEPCRCEKFLAEKEAWAERTSEGKRQRVNVRPFVRSLESNPAGLQLELVMAGSDYVRPEEVLNFGLGLPEMITVEALFIRRELLIFSDGNLYSPFSPDSHSASLGVNARDR